MYADPPSLADSATAVLDIQLLYHYFVSCPSIPFSIFEKYIQVGNYGNPTAFLSYNWYVSSIVAHQHGDVDLFQVFSARVCIHKCHHFAVRDSYSKFLS